MLLEFKNASVSGLPYSPAQLLQSRILRDKLPLPSGLLVPKQVENAKPSLQARQEKQRFYYDRTAKPLPDLKVGDTICLQEDKVWTPAIVTQTHQAPKSQIVTTHDGCEYHRNNKFLHRTAEPPPVISPPVDDMPAIPQSVPPQQHNTIPTPRHTVQQSHQPAQPRSSSRVTHKPQWHKDYLVSK